MKHLQYRSFMEFRQHLFDMLICLNDVIDSLQESFSFIRL